MFVKFMDLEADMNSEENKQEGTARYDMRDMLVKGLRLGFEERMAFFSGWVNDRLESGDFLYLRKVLSPADREVTIYDRFLEGEHRMLMFGSNNYLGLTAHPHVQERVLQAVKEYGTGIGGSPLLNGYTDLHREVEERIAAFKGTEDSVIFQSGYGANLGVLDTLATGKDVVLFDSLSHASVRDGLRLSRTQKVEFPHNNLDELSALLAATDASEGDVFLAVEGVYSMDGDVAPLDRMLALCRQHEAQLILDDAHGTGVMGPTGRGTSEYFGLKGEVDMVVTTFSKAFGVIGAAVATSKPVADYLRFFGRPYIFSTSIPPAVLAAVVAGLDVIENEPELRQRLWNNIHYTVEGLRHLGFDVKPNSPVIPLITPRSMDIREAAFHFHKRGIFISSIEYPAVALDQQRFRISLMATHTKEDIDRLLEVIEEVWYLYGGEEALERPAAELPVLEQGGEA